MERQEGRFELVSPPRIHVSASGVHRVDRVTLNASPSHNRHTSIHFHYARYSSRRSVSVAIRRYGNPETIQSIRIPHNEITVSRDSVPVAVAAVAVTGKDLKFCSRILIRNDPIADPSTHPDQTHCKCRGSIKTYVDSVILHQHRRIKQLPVVCFAEFC